MVTSLYKQNRSPKSGIGETGIHPFLNVGSSVSAALRVRRCCAEVTRGRCDLGSPISLQLGNSLCIS